MLPNISIRQHQISILILIHRPESHLYILCTPILRGRRARCFIFHLGVTSRSRTGRSPVAASVTGICMLGGYSKVECKARGRAWNGIYFDVCIQVGKRSAERTVESWVMHSEERANALVVEDMRAGCNEKRLADGDAEEAYSGRFRRKNGDEREKRTDAAVRHR
jgi:hypothetical protein